MSISTKILNLSKEINDIVDNETNENTLITKLLKSIKDNELSVEERNAIVDYIILYINCNSSLNNNSIGNVINVLRNCNNSSQYTMFDTICEAFISSEGKSSVGISLDKDGNVLISKQLNVNYDNIYAQSHRLIKQYAKSNNLNGVKYELAKQWYLLNLLENKIIYNSNKFSSMFVSEKKKQNAIKLRAFILSDYHTYMDFVQKFDKKFNFISYFKSTPFYKETYKIDKRLIQMMIPL